MTRTAYDGASVRYVRARARDDDENPGDRAPTYLAGVDLTRWIWVFEGSEWGNNDV